MSSIIWLSRNTILIYFDKKAMEVGSYSEDIVSSNLISHVSFTIWVPPRLFLFKGSQEENSLSHHRAIM